ncbi:MAG: tyrosine-protein phosphatase [Acidobacteria bacterium]|nr:tyrosine-protein phosphatase [Acidobacteriota bacterium]MCA1600691.1 tyrosine-protein phosphatase [Acidobacteriota bacterium]
MRINASRILALGAVLTLLAAPGLPQNDTRYKELSNFHKVNEGIYRGAQPKPGGLQRIRKFGIKTIVNLRDDDSRAQEEEADARSIGLRYFNIPLGRLGRPDDKDIEQVLATINDPENQPVLVHCKKGADRTGVVIAIYRITHNGWTSQQAKAEANRYGMKPWQLGMKDYIHDFYKQQGKQKRTANP